MTRAKQAQPGAKTAGKTAAQRAPTQQSTPRKRHTVADDVSPLLLSVDEAAAKIRISRAQMYRIMAMGKIETCWVGYLRRIHVQALEEFISSLPRRRL